MTAAPSEYGVSTASLAAISGALEHRSPQEVLQWALGMFRPNLAFATAFGAEGCVILAMLAELGETGKGVRIFNLDTGYQFAETMETRAAIRRRYGIDVELVQPGETVEALEERHGGPVYTRDPARCCSLRKIAPLRNALAGQEAWISAIRRDQTRERSLAGAVEMDRKFGLIKINPLLTWTKSDIWAYIQVNEVPYNKLHDLGYPSIGCRPCTRPVAHDEEDRAGRWAGLARTECGLHSRQA